MSTRQERINKGLCPNCGKIAAPYYLCGECRFGAKLGRILNRATKGGGLSTTKRDGKTYYSLVSTEKFDAVGWRADPKDSDGRLRPRLRKVPVDVEATLVAILRDAGKPCSIDEIHEAWGKLRAGKVGTVVGDMQRIMAAKEKRERRAKKLARIAETGGISA